MSVINPPATGWRGKLRYRARVLLSEPTTLIGVLLIGAFAYLVIAPLVAIVSDAVRVQYGDDLRAGASVGSSTSYYLWRVFRSPISSDLFWEPFWHTLTVGIGVILFAVALGGSMAWLVTRTNVPGRKFLAGALVVPYMLPSWTFALAWLTLFKNGGSGGTPGYLESWGVTTPNWLAYGAVPMIVTLGLHYYPFVLLLFGNALRRMDSQLEESARVLGASRGQAMRSVVLPLLLPSLSSATLLIFGRVLGTFGTPYILGLPTDYSLLSTSLYRSIHTRSSGVAAVLAAVIVLLGVLVVLFDMRLVREQRRFVTIGGKGGMDRATDLRRWRWPAYGLGLGVFVVSVVVPLLTLLISTVTHTPGVFRADNFTLRFWLAADIPEAVGFPHGLLRGGELYEAMWNSVRIVGTSALLCGLLGLLVGYVVARSGSPRISGLLRQVSFLPYLVPGIAFAAAYLTLFAVPRGPIPALYGTVTLLVLVMVVTHLPYSSRSGIAAMMQLGKEPEEAAQVVGAGWFRRLWRIVVPIQKGSLATGVILPFISGIKELSIVIMLATAGMPLLTTLSIHLVDYGYTQQANAAVLVIAVVSFAVTYLAQRATRSSLASGLGG
ncbi:iron ABC transporter permease [Micromonospora polyrhachis]|uniref:Iron(III) transport system permease protein n=1 Tax=Micromonospora polyrhachis TaxID=1282883 RepID=A0A7W7SWD5_9ACTN|nr:iron ABC transporter permease [Micromonospora polyrhachis]MBB4962188.1 iron(III) transport system permease protein [Micromonospora polyrhachis]